METTAKKSRNYRRRHRCIIFCRGVLGREVTNLSKTNPKIAKDILPDNVKYDEQKGQLVCEYASGNISVLDLR
jgi:hypothetical protein